jgi:ABC-type antimicrobial peptide transport system permease subunit
MRKYLTISIVAVSIVAVFFVVANAAPSSNANKNGWKFLTWGMSYDEVNKLLVENEMKKMDVLRGGGTIHYCAMNRDNCCNGTNAYFTSEAIKYGMSSDNFTFLFIGEKLVAVQIDVHYGGNFPNTLINQLKEKYPDGEILYDKTAYSGDEKYFLYIGNNLIINMTTPPMLC